MVEKLFWTFPYFKNLETTVESVNGDKIMLRQTIYFAFSGGQESDSGTIGGYPVLEAKTSGFDIEYLLPADHQLKKGDHVKIEIDWDRRYRLMRLHFAAELILELVYRELKGIEKIGAHISSDKARLDFLWLKNISPCFSKLAAQAQSIVDQNRKIISAYSDKVAQKRYWEIEGFARIPCGGTHLRRTGEVGQIRLKRKNIGKGKERIEVHLIENEFGFETSRRI